MLARAWQNTSGPVAQVLGLMAVPFTLNRFAAPALATLGRYATLARFSTLQLALTVTMSIAAAPYGLVAVAWAYVARAYLMLPPQMWAFKRYSGLGYGEAVWHTDMSYQDITPTGALLYGVEVTREGGETGFISMYQAYDTLPADLRAAIDGRQIKHDASYNSAGELRKGFKPVTDPSEAPGAIHPAVIRHPVTGRKALFLGRRPNGYIMGMPLAESEALPDRLWAHATQPQFVYSHSWKLHQLVMWDDSWTMHRATPYEGTHPRHLRWCGVRELEAV